MIALLLFAFLSGLVTIAAPCIWPLLPIVLSTSSLGGRRRPFGLTLGILLSFGSITLFISYVVHQFGLDASLLRTISVVVLLLMGLTMLVPPISSLLEASLSRVVGGFGWNRSGSGFWAGFTSGLPLGVVWAPCAGPILATIATLAATRAVGASIVLVTLAYLFGVGIPLFLFSAAGQRFILSTRILSRYTAVLQRVFGLVIIATAGLILFNWDTRLEANLLNAVPSYSTFLNKLEGNASVTKELDRLRGTASPTADEPNATGSSKSSQPDAIRSGGNGGLDPAHVLNVNLRAPDFKGINQWLNLPPGQSSLDLQGLRGKVVLVDFWTYTCINCIRTLPHVISWANQYKGDGLVVIGVHTPEFQFEHDTSNVKQAIQYLNIPYPVAQDNDYGTWKAYSNRYWPAEYLIDKDGRIRRFDFGEGDYDKMEQAIRELLLQTGASVSADRSGTPDQTPTEQTSPETYLGGDQMRYYYPTGTIGIRDFQDLQLDPMVSTNSFDFGGDWSVYGQFSQTGTNAMLEYRFIADHVYVVMHKPDNGNGTVKVLMDGLTVNDSNAGADVQNGTATIDSSRLYDLVDLRDHPGRHLLRLEFSPGIQVYAFTFG